MNIKESKVESILKGIELEPVRTVTEGHYPQKIREGYRFVKNCVPQIDQESEVRRYQGEGLDVFVGEKAYNFMGAWCPQLRAIFIREKN